MKKKKINGFEVNPVGIGTWGMGGNRFEDGILYADYDNDNKAIEAIRYSISKGQNHIDTAQVYGAGHTEEIIGEAISGIKQETLFIATKVFQSHYLRSAVPRAVENSLKKMGLDYLDLLYIHYPVETIPMKDYISGLNDAMNRGLVRSIGVSNFNLEELKKAQSFSRNPIIVNQLHYSLLERSFMTPEMKEYCNKHGIKVVAYRPLERKQLADQNQNSTLEEIALKYKQPTSKISLNWLISQENIVTIPKALTKEHIDENLGAMDFDLEADDILALNTIV